MAKPHANSEHANTSKAPWGRNIYQALYPFFVQQFVQQFAH
jgi:hypothetical protein